MRRSVSSCVINACVRACTEGKWAGDTEMPEAKLSDVPTIFFSCVVFRRWCVESVLEDRHRDAQTRTD